MDKSKFITYEERLELEKLKDTDFTSKDIALSLGRSSGLVKTEYRRGGGRYNYTAQKGEDSFKKGEEIRKNSYQFRQTNIKVLDLETRKKIENLKDTDLSGVEIGHKIGRHKNVINREFKMAGGRSFYNAEKSQKIADEIKKKKFDNLRKENALRNTKEKEILIDKDATSEFLETKKRNNSHENIPTNLPDYIPKLPFKIWAERFKEENAKKRAYWTKEIRYFDFWIKHFGDKIAVNISPLEIEEISNILLTQKSRLKAGTNLSRETRRKYILMLSSLYTTAIKDWKWALFNPVSSVDMRLKEKQSYTVYSKEPNELHDRLKGDLISYIKETKDRLLLSDRNLAKMCGLSFSILQRVMKPEHNVTLRIVCKICNALGLKINLEK